MKRTTYVLVLVLVLSVALGISCSKELSTDEYLRQTQKIVDAYNEATILEIDSMNDATTITQQGDSDKGYAIVEVTEHLYAEEISKFLQEWNAIVPPKEFAEYHQSVGDYFYKLENNSRTLSSCAEALLDDEETDTTKLIDALLTREEIAGQWEECATILKQALLKTRKE